MLRSSGVLPAQWCVGFGLLITPHCHGAYDPHPVRVVLSAKDHGRCRYDPARLKAPMPLRKERP